ncbi:unnamed protein product [Enterobius vermicularis]|uniref:Protein MAIN-LIKE 1-like n=1 Tax=Enterobius vermicularis TaxID=51028 RepID=A0A0N4VD92_ENTVE|nr:unnamed protein product [Enterobius vermicularis]
MLTSEWITELHPLTDLQVLYGHQNGDDGDGGSDGSDEGLFLQSIVQRLLTDACELLDCHHQYYRQIDEFCYSLASLFLRTLNSDVGVIDLSYLLVLKVWFWRVENQHVDFFTLVYRTDRLIDWLSSLTRLSAAKYYLI